MDKVEIVAGVSFSYQMPPTALTSFIALHSYIGNYQQLQTRMMA